LLVARANIANLLWRAVPRSAPDARAALGASRARLVRKALAESLTLSLVGAALGIAVAYAGARLILHLALSGADTWVPVNAAPSTPVLLFALGISVMTGVVFGIAPAWITAGTDPIEALQGASRSVGRDRHWAQKTLVIVQAALSLVLLSAAAMLGQSLRNLKHQEAGFETNGRYLVSINSMLSNYKQEQLAPLVRDIADRLGAIPGVRISSPALYAPMSRPMESRHPDRGQTRAWPGDDVSSMRTRVTPVFRDARRQDPDGTPDHRRGQCHDATRGRDQQGSRSATLATTTPLANTSVLCRGRMRRFRGRRRRL
jgi:hypothetical protein